MVDVDMESVAKRKTCEQRLKELDDEWKRKMNDLMRNASIKKEDLRKQIIERCNQRIKEVQTLQREKFRKFFTEQSVEIKKECNRKLEDLRQQCNMRIRDLNREKNRLKAENAQLAERVARTAAAMTLSGMPRKRPRRGFQNLGNPLMW